MQDQAMGLAGKWEPEGGRVGVFPGLCPRLANIFLSDTVQIALGKQQRVLRRTCDGRETCCFPSKRGAGGERGCPTGAQENQMPQVTR